MRCSRQSSWPFQAAFMRAVKPPYGGAAAAPHAVSGGGEGGAAGAAGGEGGGPGAEGAGGGWRGGAHVVRGLKVGALGDEVLEAVELAVDSRLHEGRVAVLRRRGGGATRGKRRRCGRGSSAGGGRRGRRARVGGRRSRGGGGRGRLAAPPSTHRGAGLTHWSVNGLAPPVAPLACQLASRESTRRVITSDTVAPRDSARPALLTAVRNRRSGLALHPPEGYYTAFAAPDWRGGIRVGRTSWLTQ